MAEEHTEPARPSRRRVIIHDLFNLPPGRLLISGIQTAFWGSEVTITGAHERDLQNKRFKLHFTGVTTLQWYVKEAARKNETLFVPLLSHDLGLRRYKRNARFIMATGELIISYEDLDAQAL
ncbi:MAG: hypothetical protein D6712_12990 [Chloroflexi bacterium]|nr:MAG: hypothetical protein D6712_12990 [Chloroflexota bacterium]